MAVVFKFLCFSGKSFNQTKSSPESQYIKQPKPELAALAEADEGAMLESSSLGTPLTPRRGPEGWGWGLGDSGNLEVPTDSFSFRSPWLSMSA